MAWQPITQIDKNKQDELNNKNAKTNFGDVVTETAKSSLGKLGQAGLLLSLPGAVIGDTARNTFNKVVGITDENPNKLQYNIYNALENAGAVSDLKGALGSYSKDMSISDFNKKYNNNQQQQVNQVNQPVQQNNTQQLAIPSKEQYPTNPPRFETKPIEVVDEKKYVPQVTMSNYNTPTGKSSREIDGTLQSLGALPTSVQKLNLVDNGRTNSYTNYQQNPYDTAIKGLKDQLDINMADQSMDPLVRGIKNRALRRNIESLSNAYRTNVTENLGLGDLQQRQLQNQRDYELRQRGQQLNEIKGLSDINLQSSQADKIGLDVQQARNLFEAQQVVANPDTDRNSIEYKKAKSLLDINYPNKNQKLGYKVSGDTTIDQDTNTIYNTEHLVQANEAKRKKYYDAFIARGDTPEIAASKSYDMMVRK